MAVFNSGFSVAKLYCVWRMVSFMSGGSVCGPLYVLFKQQVMEVLHLVICSKASGVFWHEYCNSIANTCTNHMYKAFI